MDRRSDGPLESDTSPYLPAYQAIGRELLKALVAGLIGFGASLWVSEYLISSAGGAAFFPPSLLGTLAAQGTTADEFAWAAFAATSVLLGLLVAVSAYDTPPLPPPEARTSGWNMVAGQRYLRDLLGAGIAGSLIGFFVWLLLAAPFINIVSGSGLTGVSVLFAALLPLIPAFFVGRWAFRRERKYGAVVFVT